MSIRIEFDKDTGIRHLNDFDDLCVPPQLSHAAKDTVITELNLKMHKYRPNKCKLLLIPLGVILFVLGGASAAWIFPYNFALLVLGFVIFVSIPISAICHRNRQRTMLKYVADLVECRTQGVIRIEFEYTLNIRFGYQSARTRRVPTFMVARVMQSKLLHYNAHNPNNYNNLNGVRDPYGNPGYPNGLNEPLVQNQMNYQGHYPPAPQYINQNQVRRDNYNLLPQYPRHQGYN